ncbi:hypothetical protein Tco_0516675 [Tanacetum coccineum]
MGHTAAVAEAEAEVVYINFQLKLIKRFSLQVMIAFMQKVKTTRTVQLDSLWDFNVAETNQREVVPSESTSSSSMLKPRPKMAVQNDIISPKLHQWRLGVGPVKSENVAADEKESVPSQPEFYIQAGSVGNVE